MLSRVRGRLDTEAASVRMIDIRPAAAPSVSGIAYARKKGAGGCNAGKYIVSVSRTPRWRASPRRQSARLCLKFVIAPFGTNGNPEINRRVAGSNFPSYSLTTPNMCNASK
jgi:hypothetical protein